MNLYDPNARNCFVYAVVAKNAKEGTKPDYKPISGASFDECLKLIDQKASRSAYPHPLGKYDEHGRYMTYKPPVEGISPGKFVLHPHSEQERKRVEAFS